jgi:DNA repair exonuclease SbcCD ATPase subunit/DNA repair exonuclease SbcCD nuclease subunit
MILRFGHTCDVHWSERAMIAGQHVVGPDGLNVRLTDVEKCFDAFTAACEKARAQFAVVAGDLFDLPRPTPTEERVAIRAVQRLVDAVGNVYMIGGNHDANGPLEANALACLELRPGVHIGHEPGYWDLRASGSTLEPHPFVPLADAAPGRVTTGALGRLCVLPWPSRAALMGDDVNAKLTPEELNQLVSKKIAGIVAGMRTLRIPGAPLILVFHGSIHEAMIGEQPVALQKDIGLSVAELVGWDYVALGHIHQRQAISIPGEHGVAHYPGGIDRFTFGEQGEEKGATIVELIGDVPGNPGFHPQLTFVPTPARPFKTHTVDEVLAAGIVDDGVTVHRVVGEVAPDQVAAIRARLAESAPRYLKLDFEVARQTTIRDPELKKTWSCDALVTRRLEARALAPDLMAELLDEHHRILAAAGGATIAGRLAGMRPLELEMTNFGSYAQETIDFEHVGPAAAIIGPNGAGKSTLLEAWRFLLTGECRDSMDQQIRRGEKEMSVRGVWMSGSRRFRLTRTVSRRTKKGSSLVTFSEWKDGAWDTYGDNALAEAKLAEITGVDDEVLLSTSFCLDAAAGDILQARAGERLRIARKLYGGEEFIPLRDAAQKKADAVGKSIPLLASDAERAQIDARAAAAAAEDIPIKEAVVFAQTSEEEHALEKLAEVQAELARVKEAESKRREHLVALTAANEEVRAAEQSLARAEKRLAEVDQIASSVVEARAGVESLKWAKAEVDAAKDAVAAAKLARDDAEKAEREHQKRLADALSRVHGAERKVHEEKVAIAAERNAGYRDAQARVKELQVRRSQFEAAQIRAKRTRDEEVKRHEVELHGHRNRLRVLSSVPCEGQAQLGVDFGSCPLIADAKASERKIPAVEQLLADAKERPLFDADAWDTPVAPTDEEIAAAQAKLDAFQSIVDPTPPSQPDLDAARATMADLGPGATAQSQREAHDAAFKALESAIAESEQLSGWPAALERSEKAAADLPAAGAELEDAKTRLDASRKRVEAARALLAQSEAGAGQEILDRLANAKSGVDAIRADLARARADLMIATRTAENLPALQQAAAKAEAGLASKQAEVKKFETLAEVYGEIPTLLIESASGAVQEMANAMLAQIGVPERVRIDTVSRNKTNDNTKDTFDILITDRNGYEAPFACYSKGERFCVDLALRRAFCELQSARAQVDDPPPLIIDEGWGTLDNERRRAFPDALRRVIDAKLFSVVLTVSHVQEVVDCFPVHIVVNQAHDGSHARVVRAA